MITIIQGKPGEGKTTLAKKIGEGKKCCFIEEHSLKHPFWAASLERDTQLIIIDDVKNLQETLSFFQRDILIVDKPRKKPFSMPMPDIILVLFSGKTVANIFPDWSPSFEEGLGSPIRARHAEKNHKRFWYFDCTDKKGQNMTLQIEALNAVNAMIIFRSRYEGYLFDPPY